MMGAQWQGRVTRAEDFEGGFREMERFYQAWVGRYLEQTEKAASEMNFQDGYNSEERM